jgi:hypothetical protein
MEVATSSVEETKQMVREAMAEDNVSPSTLISLGKMAEDVLKDKSLYPQFLQAVVDSDLADAEDMDENMDYQFIGAMAALGEMAKQMVASGELKA